jgi:hypothetical protein
MFPTPRRMALNSCIQMSLLFYYYFIYLFSAVTACHDSEPSLYGCAALSPLSDLPLPLRRTSPP